MSASVPVVQFYVVYRGLQIENTKCSLRSISQTLHPCDNTHMEAASFVATKGFCLVPGSTVSSAAVCI